MFIPEIIKIVLKKEDREVLTEILMQLEYAAKKNKSGIYDVIFREGLHAVRDKIKKIKNQEENHGKKRKKSDKQDAVVDQS